MMQAGNLDKEVRENDNGSSKEGQLQHDDCDLASDEFKKAWLKVKQIHDKELQQLQAKIMRERQLADKKQTDSAAKMEQLAKQCEILTCAVNDLQKQLNSKACDRCMINETYRRVLQKEIHNIQQLNFKLVTGLTTEISILRGEIKKISEKPRREQLYISIHDTDDDDDDDDDFIPLNGKPKLVYDVLDPTQVAEMHEASRSERGSHTEQAKSSSKIALEQSVRPRVLQQSSAIQRPKNPSDKMSSNGGKLATGGSACQMSPACLPVRPTFGAQKELGFPRGTKLPGDKIGTLKRKHETNATKSASTQKCDKKKKFKSQLSNPPSENSTPTQVASETSEGNMPSYHGRSSLFFSTRKETFIWNVYSKRCTSKSTQKERSESADSECVQGKVSASSVVISEIADSSEKTSAQVALNANESTCAGGVTKPQSDSGSALVEPKTNSELQKK